MALTILIQHDEKYKEFFKRTIPKKNDFMTLSGNKPFSNNYIERASYRLSNPHKAGLVGTAFDYMARWMVAKTVENGKNNSYEHLVAEEGMLRCKNEFEKKEINIKEKYDKVT